MRMSRPFPARLALAFFVFASLPLSSALAAQADDFGYRGDVAELLPPDTLAVLTFSGEPCGRASDALALTQIWREPEVQQFVGPVLGMLDTMSQAGWWQLQSMTGLGEEHLHALFGSRVKLAALGIQRFADAGELVDLVLTVEFGEDEEARIFEILDALESQVATHGLGEFADAELDGNAARSWRPNLLPAQIPPEIGVHYALVDRAVVLAVNRNTLSDALRRQNEDGPSLATDAAFAESARRTQRPDTVLHGYVNLNAVRRLLLQEGAEDVAQVLGLLPYEAIAFGEELDGPGVRDRLYYHAPDGRLIDRALGSDRGPLRTANLVPAETAFYAATRFDPLGYFDVMVEIFDRMEPGLRQEVEQGLIEVDQHLGMSVREDLLASLGSEFAVFASFPDQGWIPDLGLLIQVKNRDKVSRFIEQLHAVSGVEQPIRSIEYQGHRIFYLTLHDRSHPAPMLREGSLRPSWVFTGDYLLFTLWPNSAKELLAGMSRQEPALVANADFGRLAAGMTRPDGGAHYNGIVYLDIQRLVGFLLDNGTPILQTMMPDIAGVPLQPAAFPTSAPIKQHLFGLLLTSRRTPDGLYAEMYSPTGGLLLTAPLFAAAAFMGMRYSQAMQIEMMQAEAAARAAEGEEVY